MKKINLKSKKWLKLAMACGLVGLTIAVAAPTIVSCSNSGNNNSNSNDNNQDNNTGLYSHGVSAFVPSLFGFLYNVMLEDDTLSNLTRSFNLFKKDEDCLDNGRKEGYFRQPDYNYTYYYSFHEVVLDNWFSDGLTNMLNVNFSFTDVQWNGTGTFTFTNVKLIQYFDPQTNSLVDTYNNSADAGKEIVINKPVTLTLKWSDDLASNAANAAANFLDAQPDKDDIILNPEFVYYYRQNLRGVKLDYNGEWHFGQQKDAVFF